MKLPRSMDRVQEKMREQRAQPDFDLLTDIMEQYNEEDRTLDDLAAGLSVATGTLYGWLKDVGVRIDRRMIRKMVPVGEVNE